MYKCKKCGNIFENTSLGVYDSGYDPEVDGYISDCPDCGSDDFIEVEPCRVCGDYVCSDAYFKMCESCEANVRKDMKKKLFEFCKNLEDYEFDILEDIVSQVELQYVIRDIKKEMEEE